MSSTKERLDAAVKNLTTYSDECDSKDSLTGEDIAELKSRMEEVATMRGQYEADAQAKGEMAEAKKFLSSLSGGDAEKKAAKVTTEWGAPANPAGKTLGEMFIESDAFGDFIGRYSKGGVIPNQVKGVQSLPFMTDIKTLVTGTSSTSGGAFVRNDLYGPVTDLIGQRELTVADLVTKSSTSSDSVDYVRVTAKTNNAATVAEATTSAAGAISGATPGPYTVATPSGTKPESALTFELIR